MVIRKCGKIWVGGVGRVLDWYKKQLGLGWKAGSRRGRNRSMSAKTRKMFVSAS